MVEGAAQRLDKWLWHARFLKTRSAAAAFVEAGRVRLRGSPAAKPSQLVRAGDVLTFMQGAQVRVVRVVAFAERRGPAEVARLLYEDITPAAPKPL
ncbi:RNA-binding S4 domain-containing protein [Zavarzinia sp. CC-PAN008]|uniref:RNA-binding S4 domain-containing protein n=1 Tax=Zavarzinia sp. CC-PAN008 TaxID=3243332 RepID=UPI003F7478A9